MSFIYVGDEVVATYEMIGMSHRETHVGRCIVTAVMPSPRVRPVGRRLKEDLPCTWGAMTKVEDPR